MTLGSTPLLPGSRVLAGWWSALAHWQPAALWFCRLQLCHIEAPVTVLRTRALDNFERALLRVLTSGAAASLEQLSRSLYLGTSLLTALIRRLQRDGLVACMEGAYSLTPAAASALADGACEQRHAERRVFHFLLSEDHAVPPHYLALQAMTCTAAVADDRWNFDPASLESAIAQADDWKRKHGFPQTVRSLVDWRSAGSTPSADAGRWRSVILARPEQLCAVLVKASDAERILALQVVEDGWQLLAGQPVFESASGWRELFPEVSEDDGGETWRQAWLDWCAIRHIAHDDAIAVEVKLEGISLGIRGPDDVISRISGQFDHQADAWLLAGSGRLRRMARLKLGT
jgi:hypothetical protein